MSDDLDSRDEEARKKEAAAFFAFLERNRKEVERFPAWILEAHGISLSPRHPKEETIEVPERDGGLENFLRTHSTEIEALRAVDALNAILACEGDEEGIFRVHFESDGYSCAIVFMDRCVWSDQESEQYDAQDRRVPIVTTAFAQVKDLLDMGKKVRAALL